MPAFCCAGTYLETSGATTTGLVGYSIVRYGGAATAWTIVSVPLCLFLAGGAGARAPRLELLCDVLGYYDMHDQVRPVAATEFCQR